MAVMIHSLQNQPCPSFKSLPDEVLVNIVQSSSMQDLLILRRTCKALHRTSLKFFAQAFFGDRAVVLSKKGLTSLLRLAEDNDFAPHVKTIIIAHGGAKSTPNHEGLLLEALKKLAAFGKLTTIGFRHFETPNNYEENVHEAYRTISPFFHRHMLQPTLDLGFNLTSVTVDFEAPFHQILRGFANAPFGSQNSSAEASERAQRTSNVLTSLEAILPQNFSVTIRVVHPEDSLATSGATARASITHDRESESLSATGASIYLVDMCRIDWFEQMELKELSLKDCDLAFHSFRTLLENNLIERLILENVNLYYGWLTSNPSNQLDITDIYESRSLSLGKWQKALKEQSRTCPLKYLRIKDLVGSRDGSIFGCYEATGSEDVEDLITALVDRSLDLLDFEVKED